VTDDGAVAVSFDMQLTDADLHRLAPALTPDREVAASEGAVRGSWGTAGSWSIRIVARGVLAIALLRLPTARIEIRFDGLDADERRAFLARFHLVFRRGGG